MNYDYLLSIVFITMNRKNELKKAIQSCLNADLPSKYEIIVIDNGSTDGSETFIIESFPNISIKYYVQDKNYGIGGGRNIGLKYARGKYVYILDDDAYINPKYNDSFFTSSIKMFEDNPKIGGLTTSVYDTALKRYRLSDKGKHYKSDNTIVYMLHGNTHFLRNNIPNIEYCPCIKYGYEDLYASIRLIDEGYLVCLNENVETIHDPKVNKWIPSSPQYFDIIVKEIAGKLTVKALLFPKIMYPILKFAAYLRTRKSLKGSDKRFSDVISLYKSQTKGVKVKKVRIKTIRYLLREYGINAII